MKLSDLNNLSADRLQRAMIASGVELMSDEEEVLFRGDSPASKMLMMLLVGWMGNIDFSEEQIEAVIAAAAAAFCLGCSYESLGEVMM